MDLLGRIDMFVGFDINEETEYQKFFNKKMKEWGISSPGDLDDDEKKKFFDEVDREWTGEKNESSVVEMDMKDEEECEEE